MQSLQFLIDKLSHSRKLHISILDLSGILDTPNTKIDIKNVVHSCKYCAIAKSTPKGGKACLRCKMLANTKAINTKEPFGGHCLYGLYEIVLDNRRIFAVSASDSSEFRLSTVEDAESVFELYELISENGVDTASFDGVLDDYLYSLNNIL